MTPSNCSGEARRLRDIGNRELTDAEIERLKEVIGPRLPAVQSLIAAILLQSEQAKAQSTRVDRLKSTITSLQEEFNRQEKRSIAQDAALQMQDREFDLIKKEYYKNKAFIENLWKGVDPDKGFVQLLEEGVRGVQENLRNARENLQSIKEDGRITKAIYDKAEEGLSTLRETTRNTEGQLQILVEMAALLREEMQSYREVSVKENYIYGVETIKKELNRQIVVPASLMMSRCIRVGATTAVGILAARAFSSNPISMGFGALIGSGYGWISARASD